MTAKASEDITPLMAYESLANIKTGVTSSRRNKSSVINRTNKYKNIDDGLIPSSTHTSTATRGIKV